MLLDPWDINAFLAVKAILHYNISSDIYTYRSLYIFQGVMYTHVESIFKIIISVLSLCLQ